jgi:hypothetical protein
MAQTPGKSGPQSGSKTNAGGFQYGPLIAGWLLPGGGHFLQRKWVRGALLFAAIGGMFILGVAMQGKLFTSASQILDLLRLVGELCSGIFYLVARQLGLGADGVQVTTADYGTTFIVVAGLLNVIAAVDAHNLYTGRKQ